MLTLQSLLQLSILRLRQESSWQIGISVGLCQSETKCVDPEARYNIIERDGKGKDYTSRFRRKKEKETRLGNVVSQ